MKRLSKGIVTGDTISVVLFSSARNLMGKSVEMKYKNPFMKSCIHQPPAKAFVDDPMIGTNYSFQTRWLLTYLEEIIKWARNKFNVKKSRSMAMKKDSVTNKMRSKSNTRSMNKML